MRWFNHWTGHLKRSLDDNWAEVQRFGTWSIATEYSYIVEIHSSTLEQFSSTFQHVPNSHYSIYLQVVKLLNNEMLETMSTQVFASNCEFCVRNFEHLLGEIGALSTGNGLGVNSVCACVYACVCEKCHFRANTAASTKKRVLFSCIVFSSSFRLNI